MTPRPIRVFRIASPQATPPPRARVTRDPVLLLPPGALAVRRLGRGLNAPGHLFLLRIVRKPMLRHAMPQLGAPMATAPFRRESPPIAWPARTGMKLNPVRGTARKVAVSLADYDPIRVVVRAAENPAASLTIGVAMPAVPEPPWIIGRAQTRPGRRRPRPTFWAMSSAPTATWPTAKSMDTLTFPRDRRVDVFGTRSGVGLGQPSVRIRLGRTGGCGLIDRVWAMFSASAHA